MLSRSHVSLSLALVSAGLFATGCSGRPAPTAEITRPSSQSDVRDSHAGHEHGRADDAHGHADHAHPSEGPHHGHLIELGHEYHAELNHDDDTHTVTVHLLDSAAEHAVAADANEVTINLVVDGRPAQFTLPAAPLDGETVERASRFEITNETLCNALDAPIRSGRLNVSIQGMNYVGTIEHDEHSEHAH